MGLDLKAIIEESNALLKDGAGRSLSANGNALQIGTGSHSMPSKGGQQLSDADLGLAASLDKLRATTGSLPKVSE